MAPWRQTDLLGTSFSGLEPDPLGTQCPNYAPNRGSSARSDSWIEVMGECAGAASDLSNVFAAQLLSHYAAQQAMRLVGAAE